MTWRLITALEQLHFPAELRVTMLFHILLAYSLFAIGLAAPFANYTRCENSYSASDIQAIEAQYIQDLQAAEAAGEIHRDDALAPTLTVPSLLCRTVKVVWHIIYESTTVQKGYMSDQTVRDSIKAMNTHFSGSGFKFVLDKITRTQNAEWFNKVDSRSSLQDDMKKKLHVGDATTLNVYTVNFPRPSALGYAYLPQYYAANPWNDGVVIKHSSVPGGAATNFNQGKTLTHEVGHWLGLLHVFNEQGQCVEQDMVSDTPVQSTETLGCPASKDSCPNLPGADSIHNFMDYSWDSCMTSFTPGQITRMKEQSDLYRRIPSRLCISIPTFTWLPPTFTVLPPVPTPDIPGGPIPGPDPAPF